MQHPEPLESAFHAHIPGQSTNPPIVDSDTQFRQQVFGCNFGLTNDNDECHQLPAWTDQAGNETTLDIAPNPEPALPAHPVPHCNASTM